MKNYILLILGFILITALMGKVSADTCTTNAISGDQNCVNGNYSYMIPSAATLNAEATAAAALNTPANLFNVNTFIQQLAASTLGTDVNVSPYYGQFKDFLSFKNFQGAANFLAALLNAGKLNQTEIDTIDNTLENQQMNLASYNSQVNVSY